MLPQENGNSQSYQESMIMGIDIDSPVALTGCRCRRGEFSDNTDLSQKSLD